MSVNLMKGFTHHSTVTATIETLNLLLELESKHTPPSTVSDTIDLRRIGYVIPITFTGLNTNLLWLAGIKEEYYISKRESEKVDISGDSFKRIVEHIMPDKFISMLAVSLAAAMLENSEHDSDIVSIYQFLLEAADLMPDTFLIMYVLP